MSKIKKGQNAAWMLVSQAFPQFVHNYFYPIFAIRLKNPTSKN
jgi:hypothetical protein